MKRRDFLRNVMPVGLSLPYLSFGSRHSNFIQEVANLGTIFSPPAETDHILVLVQLSGGNDGLNTVIPLEHFDNYVAARNNIYIPESKVLKLKDQTKSGLHPSLSGLQSLYNEGQLAIIQSVGYPNPSFSHFRSTDIWMSGSDSNIVSDSGWAGRYLNYAYPNFPNGYPNSSMTDPPAIQVGSIPSLTLEGPSVNMGISIGAGNGNNFYTISDIPEDPAPDSPGGRELSYIRNIGHETQEYSAAIRNASASVTSQLAYPKNNPLADQLKFVSRMIAGGLNTRIYMVFQGGFDSHGGQVDSADSTKGMHASLLQNMGDAIRAFQDDLRFQKVDDRVVGMTFSEFGRRIKSNGSMGTDHGAAGPMFLFGKNVNGGVFGDTPDPGTNVSASANLPFQYDFRSVYATLLTNWLCMDQSDINQVLFRNFQLLPVINSFACKKTPNLSGVSLVSNYPNPFSSKTVISFNSSGGHCLVQILNNAGRLITTLSDREYPAGKYSIAFDSGNLACGIYYVRFQNLSLQQVRTIIKAA